MARPTQNAALPHKTPGVFCPSCLSAKENHHEERGWGFEAMVEPARALLTLQLSCAQFFFFFLRLTCIWRPPGDSAGCMYGCLRCLECSTLWLLAVPGGHVRVRVLAPKMRCNSCVHESIILYRHFDMSVVYTNIQSMYTAAALQHTCPTRREDDRA